MTKAARGAKRMIDVTVACAAMLLFSPVFVAITIAILASDGLPVFFRSRRTGLKGQSFTMLKFRTMSDERDAHGTPLADSERITRLGRFLRRTSLDELPQLINVLKGDMSIVGPRPLFDRYLSRYTEDQMIRHDVKPGLTGWAQVNYTPGGRTWDEKFEQDLYYVRNWSLALDMKIVCLTIPALFVRYTSRVQGHSTSTEFTGGTSHNDSGQ